MRLIKQTVNDHTIEFDKYKLENDFKKNKLEKEFEKYKLGMELEMSKIKLEILKIKLESPNFIFNSFQTK